MSRPYHAALIGLGRIADTIDDEKAGSAWLYPFSHMGAYREVPEIVVVGACSRSVERRVRFGQRWGLATEHLYERYDQMIECEQPDIVSVCTPTAPRAEIVCSIAEMVRQGRSRVRCIWAEKPLASSLREADAMVAACRRAGVLLVVNAMRLSDVYYRRARALIDAGELGTMLQVTAYWPGNLSHMGSHSIGLMCLLSGGTGRVQWVVGECEDTSAVLDSDDDVRGNAYLAFESGARGFLRTIPTGVASYGIDAIGETGKIRVRSTNGANEFELWRTAPAVTGGFSAPVRHIFPRPQSIWSSTVGQIKDIVECLETGKEPNASGDLGRHLLEVAIAIRESHRRGHTRIDLPLPNRDLTMWSSDSRNVGRKGVRNCNGSSIQRYAATEREAAV
jgi:predicted dehydrogenase